MDCSPTGSSVYGISQTRIMEWVAISQAIFVCVCVCVSLLLSPIFLSLITMIQDLAALKEYMQPDLTLGMRIAPIKLWDRFTHIFLYVCVFVYECAL